MENNEVPNNLSDEEVIDSFIEGIMAEKGVEAPTEEIKNNIKEDLKNQLLQQIERSLVAELPDDKIDELNNKVSADGQLSPEEVAKAIEGANLNVTEITAGTMQRFREIYLGKASESESQPLNEEKVEA